MPTKNTAQKRAIVYTRLSAHRGADDPSTSPASQRKAGEAYVAAKGWELLEVLDDDIGQTASLKGLRLDRPGLQHVREFYGKADVLVFTKMDRLARSTRDFLTFAEEAERHGLDLVSIDDNVDMTTASGRFFATLLAAFAELEAATIAARSTAGVAELAEQRRHRGGKVPYGYRTVPHPTRPGVALAIEPAEAEIIREAARRIVEERSSVYREAVRLADEGHRTRTGKRWSTSSLRAVLTGDAVVGHLTHRGRPVLDEEGYPEQVWPPILTYDVWYDLRRRYPPRDRKAEQERTAKGRQRPRTGRPPSARLLSGVLICAGCRRPLRLSGAKRKRDGSGYYSPRYACGARGDGRACDVRVTCSADEADAYVEHEFLRALGPFDVVRMEVTAADPADLARIESAIDAVLADMRRPGADLGALGEKLGALHEARADLEAAPVEPEVRKVRTGRTLAEEWAVRDLAGRRELLTDRVEAVILGPGSGSRRRLEDRISWRGVGDDYDAPSLGMMHTPSA